VKAVENIDDDRTEQLLKRVERTEKELGLDGSQLEADADADNEINALLNEGTQLIKQVDKMNEDFQDMGLTKQISMGSESTASVISEGSMPWSSELSSPELFSRQCTEIDAKALQVVLESQIKEAVETAAMDCHFCVTVADPRDEDVPLIAVSDQFANITGYSRSELVGKNCRMLQSDCPMMDQQDLWKLRTARMTGAPFTGVLVNRRKTGELFLNLLDLRGLTVARNPLSGKELWFLIGIQADVTNLVEDPDVDHHVPELERSLEEVAARIRANLVDELKDFAVSGALMTNFEGHAEVDSGVQQVRDAWCVLPEPTWCRSSI
jgi:hypothetical protein